MSEKEPGEPLQTDGAGVALVNAGDTPPPWCARAGQGCRIHPCMGVTFALHLDESKYAPMIFSLDWPGCCMPVGRVGHEAVLYSLSLLTPLQPDTPLRNTLDNSDLARSLLSLPLFVHPEHTTLVQRRPGPRPANTDSPSSSTDFLDSVLPPPHRTPTPSTETRRLTGRHRSHELDRYQTRQQEERASWNHLWYVCACFLYHFLGQDRPERLSGRCLTPYVLSPVPRDGTGRDSAPVPHPLPDNTTPRGRCLGV